MFTPLKLGADNSKIIKDVEIFRSLTTDIVAPNEILSMPERLLGDFLEFTSKHHELHLSKCTGSTKTIWDTNLRMTFSRWKETSDLITN